mgnify:CR=1 FL=1
MTAYLGHIAALATSVAWTFTSVLFTLSVQKVGASVVNRMRLLLGLAFALIMHLILEGSLIPQAEPFRWGWLAASGFIGYVLGDGALFLAFERLGARLGMLLMALAPVLSTLLAWVVLGEVLTPLELLGIGLAVSGVAMVVAGPRNGGSSGTAIPEGTDPGRYYLVGVLFGLGAALGQAVGLLSSRMGLQGDFSALSGNVIRLSAATLSIWVIALARRQIASGIRALREKPQAMRTIAGGAVFGPFVGVWLSLIAVQLAPLGIASTLTSLAPVFLLPVSYFLFKERFGVLAILGTLVAVAGTALLFL